MSDTRKWQSFGGLGRVTASTSQSSRRNVSLFARSAAPEACQRVMKSSIEGMCRASLRQPRPPPPVPGQNSPTPAKRRPIVIFWTSKSFGYPRSMPKRPTTLPRPSALVRAEHGSPPVKLTAPERDLLDEALRRGEDLREEVEAKVFAYGRWLLDAVFHDDATAALDGKSKNPVWLELVRRAGGPTLKLTTSMLYVALRIAAYDRRIADQAWRGLDAGRKERLLPLGDAASIRKAAHHVADLDLSQTKTKEYVTQLLAAAGKTRRIRVTPRRISGHVGRLTALLGKPEVLRRVRGMRAEMTDAERKALLADVAKLRAALEEVVRAVK